MLYVRSVLNLLLCHHCPVIIIILSVIIVWVRNTHHVDAPEYTNLNLNLTRPLRAVSGKIPLPILPEDSLRVSKIASACEESIRTRAFVELDYGSN